MAMSSSRIRALSINGSGREGGHVVEMQRRRLLLAFSEILAEDGLECTGVGRVCKRAGVSRRTFYELFDDRETCFLGVVDAAIERLSERVLPAYRDRRPASKLNSSGQHSSRSRLGGRGQMRWRDRVRAGLTVLLECFDEEPMLAHVCLVEALKGGPEVLERRRQTLEVLASIVDEGRLEAKDGGNGLPVLTAQGAVGGVASVLHARVVADDSAPLLELLNPLMSMIVLPYLGPAASRRELERPTPKPVHASNGHLRASPQDPFKDLPIRLTFRTARVLSTIGTNPGASNRQIGDQAGVHDQGQISKLLRRLENHGLIENHGEGHTKGEPNAWQLTQRGTAIQHAIQT